MSHPVKVYQFFFEKKQWFSYCLWETIHCSLHRLFRASLGWAVLSWRNWDQICKSFWSNPLLLSSKNQPSTWFQWVGSGLSDGQCVCVRSEGRKPPRFTSTLMWCWSVILSLMWMLKLSLKPRVGCGKQHSSVWDTIKPWHLTAKCTCCCPRCPRFIHAGKIRAAIKKWSAALLGKGRHY